MSTPLNTIYSWFETGDFPTQAQFQATFSSFFHRDEDIPVSKVEGLTEMFQSTVSSETLELHFEDAEAHAATLAKRNAANIEPEHAALWKEKLGITNIATIDTDPQAGDGNVFDKLQIAQFFATVNQIQSDYAAVIEGINQALLSNDLDLDELQEVVNYIKANRADIEALQAIPIGVTDDSKVSLTDAYPEFGGLSKQKELNILLSNKVIGLENAVQDIPAIRTMTATVADTGTITHNWDTMKVMVQTFDSATGDDIECQKTRLQNGVRVVFNDTPVNPVTVLMIAI